jgi:hypothetical protein
VHLGFLALDLGVDLARGSHPPILSQSIAVRVKPPGPNHTEAVSLSQFLAAVLDAWSRRCGGWSMRDDVNLELVVDAFRMAVTRRRPTRGPIYRWGQRKRVNTTQKPGQLRSGASGWWLAGGTAAPRVREDLR